MLFDPSDNICGWLPRSAYAGQLELRFRRCQRCQEQEHLPRSHDRSGFVLVARDLQPIQEFKRRREG